jgi:hypothetical protein
MSAFALKGSSFDERSLLAIRHDLRVMTASATFTA